VSLRGRSLTFGYDRSPVLHDLSLEVRRGEVVGLVGPNGAGKSSVVRLLSRVVVPSRGEVLLDDVPLYRMRRRELARRLAVVPQGSELPEAFRVEEIVAMGRSPYLGFLGREGERDLQAIRVAMRRTGIWELRDRPVEELSGGERQRVVLARAIAQEPSYLLLDEPTSHLDLRYQMEVLGFVRAEVARGVGSLVVLHDLNLAARVCHRVLVLKGGRLVAAGTPTAVLSERLLQDVYDTDVQVVSGAADGLPIILPRV
jgi:iron complex transport system ATP-binding protein